MAREARQRKSRAKARDLIQVVPPSVSIRPHFLVKLPKVGNVCVKVGVTSCPVIGIFPNRGRP